MLKRIYRRLKKKNKNQPQFKGRGINTVTMPDCVFGHPENITLGNNVYIGEGTKIYAQASVTVCDGAIIADTVDIRTANHYYDGQDLNMLPFDEKVLISPVVIGENAWVASHVLILPGVTVGEGAVVAAGAVVTKDIPPFAVAGGNPAKVIKYRDKEKYFELKQKDKIFMKEYYTAERKMILQKKTEGVDR